MRNIKLHPVKNTPFQLYYGGKEIEGQCKWVITSEDFEMLDKILSDIDQLWVNKYEAEWMVKDWMAQNTGA